MDNNKEMDVVIEVLRERLKGTNFEDLDLSPLNVLVSCIVLIDILKKDVWVAKEESSAYILKLQRENEELKKAYSDLEEKCLAEAIMKDTHELDPFTRGLLKAKHG